MVEYGLYLNFEGEKERGEEKNYPNYSSSNVHLSISTNYIALC